MFPRWFPFFATTALLALAAVAPAQNRSRGRGDQGGQRSSSRGTESRGPSRSSGNSSRPAERSNGSRDGGFSDRSRGSSSYGRSDRGGFPSQSNRGGSYGRNDRGSYSGRSDRRNPFGYGTRRNDDQPSFGYGSYRSPSRYDGRGRASAVRFGTPPIHSALGLQIRRSGYRSGYDVVIGGQFGGLRVGYVSYGSGWGRRSSSFGVGFGYPYYAYDPFLPDVAVVASPWYRYSSLPPYIDNTRVIVVNNYPSQDRGDWRDYDYRSDRRDERPLSENRNDRRDDGALNEALDDLRDAFERNDERTATQLVPRDGDVAIFNDGKYDYSLNADDFEKMFVDGVEGSKTARYEVVDTSTRGDDVRVRARHEFEDSWGEKQSVTHTLTLRRDRDGKYVIREFGTE